MQDNNDKGNSLNNSIRDDLRNREEWREKAERLVRHRLGERKRNTIYPGAPNFIEPIIDDNIRAKVAQELSVMFSSRQLATFIPMNGEAAEAETHAEAGFDSMIKLMLNFHSKMEHAIDNKCERGFAVLKMVGNKEAYGKVMGKQYEPQIIPHPLTGQLVEIMTEKPSPTIPDVEVVDPYDIVVPMSTKYMINAERITQIHRYPTRKFKELGESNGWKNYLKVVEKAEEKQDEKQGTEYNSDGSHPHVGLEEVNDELLSIRVWEVYHYNDEGEKTRTIFSPMCPEHILEEIPWIWTDDGTPRAWPFSQLRQENRRQEFYDTRGDAELLLDNQKAAISYMNAKGIQLDFYSKPLLKGGRGTNQNVKWIPGETLPDGIEPVQMPAVSNMFDYSADIERSKAARRSGASQGSYGDTRQGGDKTATQVNAESLSSQRLTNVSVLRDGEPLSQFFELMWDFLRHNPVALPMVNESGQFQGQISEAIYKLPFRIRAAASAQHLNPDFVLQQMMSLGQFFQSNPYIRQQEFAKILVDQVNPQLTNKLVFDPEKPGDGTMPLEQQVQQMQQQAQEMGHQMGEQLQNNTEQIDNNTKYIGSMALADQEEARTQKERE